MARVVMQAVVSVDGYIAYPDDTVGPLFDWYGNGDTEVSARASGWTFHVSQSSADYVQPFWDAMKVTVIGRHLFDTTNGWDGDPAAGDELVVVTRRPLPEAWLADHPDAPFHTAGSVEAGIALAKKLAGDGLVCVTAGDVGGQAFSAGLVDEIAMDVAPVVLGEGVRFFGSHAGTVLLDELNAATGALSRRPASTAGTVSAPELIVLAPDGKNAYVTGDIGDLSQYAISPAAGKITPLSPATVTTPSGGSSDLQSLAA